MLGFFFWLQLLNRPHDLYESNKLILKTDAEQQDIITIVDGLIDIFTIKLYRLPSTHAIRIFHLLIGHLERYYMVPALLDGSSKIRFNIFNWMLKARANGTYHIGYPDPSCNGAIRYSHYLGLDILHSQHSVGYPQPQQQQPQQQQSQQQSQIATGQSQQPEPIPAATLSTISIRRGCQRIVECLKIDNGICRC